VPLLNGHPSNNEQVEKARKILLDWDYRMDPNSIAAGIYEAWQKEIQKEIRNLYVSEDAQPLFRSLPMKRTIDWILSPDGHFGMNPIKGRDDFLLATLEAAVNSLSESYGDKLSNWVYGQIDYKHIMLWHQLSTVVKPDIAAKLNVGPLPRGGDGFTVNNTGGYNNQYSGASFRILVDTEDWDRTLGMNNPGQSGNPNSRYYNNLFEEWASDGFFPLFYSREKVESVTSEKIKLIPNKHFK
jgi:penicillin amidase